MFNFLMAVTRGTLGGLLIIMAHDLYAYFDPFGWETAQSKVALYIITVQFAAGSLLVIDMVARIWPKETAHASYED